MSLVTRCPKCHHDFLASLDELRMHEGLVRCGNCANIFDAYANLESQLPTLTRRANALQPQTSSDPYTHVVAPEQDQHFDGPLAGNELEPAVLRHRQNAQSFVAHQMPVEVSMRPDDLRSDPVLSVQGEARLPLGQMNTAARRTPDFLSEDEGAAVFMRVLWSVASVVAVLALIAQALYIYRNDIATRLPILQPVLTSVCAKIGCDISLSRHLERISIDASSLQQSGTVVAEGQPAELSLRLTMRNRYDKNQPWPHLSLSLKDASGTTVARKTIAPHQYLPSSLIDQPFAAGQEVSLLLPLTVNGLQINGFQLDKFFP